MWHRNAERTMESAYMWPVQYHTEYPLQNPEIMRKLNEEIDTSFTSEAQITPQSVWELPLILACLAETGRIYPTGLSGQSMLVPPAGDIRCGQCVPGGVSVPAKQTSHAILCVVE